jgi:hypothetical protein
MHFRLIAAAVATVVALIVLPWLVITWGRWVTRRPPQDAPIARWIWRWGVLLPLIPLGTYLLIGSFVHTWGWAATIWFFTASALRGLLTPRDA